MGGGFRFKNQGLRGGGFVYQGRFGPSGRRFGRRHGAGAGRGAGPRGRFGPAGPLSGGFDPGQLLDLLRRKIGSMRPSRDGRHRHDTIALTPELARTGGPYAYLAPHNKKKLVVKIPPNVRAGQTIRLAGMGQAGQNGGRNGDLYLRVRIKTPLMDKLKRGLTRLIK
jgi:curved DNA-binding protein CbpA